MKILFPPCVPGGTRPESKGELNVPYTETRIWSAVDRYYEFCRKRKEEGPGTVTILIISVPGISLPYLNSLTTRLLVSLTDFSYFLLFHTDFFSLFPFLYINHCRRNVLWLTPSVLSSTNSPFLPKWPLPVSFDTGSSTPRRDIFPDFGSWETWKNASSLVKSPSRMTGILQGDIYDKKFIKDHPT